MKRLLLGTVALAALSVPATAADMGVRRPIVRPAPYYTWTGCYIGPYIGYSWGTSRASSEPGAVDLSVNGVAPFTGVSGVPGGPFPGAQITPNFRLGGMMGGGTAGCQVQWGNWVLGIEGDGGPTDKEGQANFQLPFNPSHVFQTNERWTATLRGRLGWAVDKWLFYATGGVAWAGVEATAWRGCFHQNGITQCPDGGTIEPGGGVPSIHQKQTMFGYSVGAGAEYSIGYGWSVKSEYVFMDFRSKDFFNPPDSITCCNIAVVNGIARGSFPSPVSVRLYDHTWKWGLNYKFDWLGGKAVPVVTK